MFKEWLISESVSISPDITQLVVSLNTNRDPLEIAKGPNLKLFVTNILKQYYRKDYNNINNRYEVTLKSIKEYWGDMTLSFVQRPINFRSPEYSTPDDYMHDFNQQHRGGKTGNLIHKSPSDAIKEIPVDPNLVYRGMSWEEWQSIKKTGMIHSKGAYNLGLVQDNWTFYGSAETAEYYANGFAPTAFKTSFKKPSVVIAIPRKNVKSHEDHPESIPGSEFAHQGPLSSREIVSAWMLSPVKAKEGKFELILKYKFIENEHIYKLIYTSEGSRVSPSIEYVLRKLL